MTNTSTQQDAPSPSPSGLARVTVLLTPSAYAALNRSAAAIGDNLTDTHSRALVAYDYLRQAIDAGHGTITLDLRPGQRVSIHIAEQS